MKPAAETFSKRSVRRDRDGVCIKCGFASPTCTYCSMPLSPRHEHDHFPIPKEAGGVETYPICINCHDLKDRVDILDWAAAAGIEAWQTLPPLGKLMVAKLIREVYSLRKQLEEAKA